MFETVIIDAERGAQSAVPAADAGQAGRLHSAHPHLRPPRVPVPRHRAGREGTEPREGPRHLEQPAEGAAARWGSHELHRMNDALNMQKGFSIDDVQGGLAVFQFTKFYYFLL